MIQQINLYQPMFRSQKKIFSAATILQTSAAFIVVFSLIYAYGAFQLQPVRKELDNTNNEIRELAAKIENIESQFPSRSKSLLLESEIAKINKELANRKKIQSVLQQNTFGNSNGFSGYLEAFARRHVQGTWLTMVKISEGGQFLGLKGKTLSSSLVPVYIGQLANEELLAGRSFNVMEMSRSDINRNQLNFYVSTN